MILSIKAFLCGLSLDINCAIYANNRHIRNTTKYYRNKKWFSICVLIKYANSTHISSLYLLSLVLFHSEQISLEVSQYTLKLKLTCVNTWLALISEL